MKSVGYIFLFLLIAAGIMAQQKFKTGVYANLSPPDSQKQNLWQVKNMGANSVIHHSRDDSWHSKDSLDYYDFDEVIIVNAYSNEDFIHHYSAGYYTKWESENTTENIYIPGVKHEGGERLDDCWKSKSTDFFGALIVTGPDYRQDRKYKFWYNTDTIHYNVDFRMKMNGAVTDSVPVCEIYVKYRSTLGYDTVLAIKTVYDFQLSDSFKTISLQYKIPDSINCNPIELTQRTISRAHEKFSDAIIEPPYYGPYGVQFNVKWLAPVNKTLYVDYIEVYDEYVWGYYLENTGDINNRMVNYANTLKTANTKYWYSLDEPHSIDNYEPCRVVNSILVQSVNAPLITAFYPGWNGTRNHEFTIKRFMETVQPDRLMYDYYPYYYPQSYEPFTDETCLRIQRELMQQPYDLVNGIPGIGDYYYIAQAFGWTPP